MCGVRIDGKVQCYGSLRPQFATEEGRQGSAIIALQTSATAVAAAFGLACAIDTDGYVRCWGSVSDRKDVEQPVLISFPRE